MKRPRKMFNRPKGCLTPNEVGRKVGVTGEAVKQWIYKGKIKAARADNGYWWIREPDLAKFMDSVNKLEFKFHNTYRKK